MSNPAFSAIAELLDILPDAVLIVDGDGCVAYANPAVRGLLGYMPGELKGQPLSILLPPAVRGKHEAHVRRFRESGHATMMGARPVLSALHRSGKVVPVSISICNLTLEGEQRVSVAVVHDVSTLNTHLDRATEQAETDGLTGLANRLRLSRRMRALLDTDRPFALLFMDLRCFKEVNDRYGHASGDEALGVVGRRLTAQVRDRDLVARLGGDEFVVLVDALDDAALLEERAHSIIASIGRPIHLKVGCVSLGVNVGGAIRFRHGLSEQALLAAADQAMYQAKQAGQGYRLAAG